MKIRTQYNYDFEKSPYENGGGEVIAIPDLSLTVKEILERFRRGSIEDLSEYERKVVYDDDEDINSPLDEIDDITDLARIIEKAQARVDSLRRSQLPPPSSDNVVINDKPDVDS